MKIYLLRDPRDNSIRYVGITRMTLRDRLLHHVRIARSGEKTHRASWVRHLISFNLIPIIELIEENSNFDREVYWIKYYRDQGHDLVNTTEGGVGTRGNGYLKKEKRKSPPPISEATREKLRLGNLGKKHSEETRRKLSELLKGRKYPPLSEEAKDKIRKSKLGKPRDEATRRKLSKALLGRKNGPPSEETRRKISIAKKGKPQPIELRKLWSEQRRGKPWSKERRQRHNEKHNVLSSS